MDSGQREGSSLAVTMIRKYFALNPMLLFRVEMGGGWRDDPL